jgi:hypothetical protein
VELLKLRSRGFLEPTKEAKGPMGEVTEKRETLAQCKEELSKISRS